MGRFSPKSTRVPKGGRPLALTHRRVAREWHPTKNGPVTPSDVSYGSNWRAWWQCSKGHEWEAVIAARALIGSGCPYCAGTRPTPDRVLARTHPELAAEWHPTRNGSRTPADVSFGSEFLAWWRCRRHPRHEWQARVLSRAGGSRCPHCSNTRVSGFNSLATRFPKIAAQWHPTKNGALTPHDVVPGSNRYAWWKCDKGRDHVWRTMIMHRTRNRSGCPCCSGKKPSRDNALAAIRPTVAAQWHPTKNGQLTPWDVTYGSGKRVWWKCAKGPDHEWQSSVDARRDKDCPFCAGSRVSITNCLATTDPGTAALWHRELNGTLTPRDVKRSSTRRVWWQCPRGFDHEWQAEIATRVRGKGQCPFCLGQRVSTTNALATVHPKIAAEWHPHRNGRLTPWEVLATEDRQRWWQCRLGHVWRSSTRWRTSRRRGCPECALAGSPRVARAP